MNDILRAISFSLGLVIGGGMLVSLGVNVDWGVTYGTLVGYWVATLTR